MPGVEMEGSGEKGNQGAEKEEQKPDFVSLEDVRRVIEFSNLLDFQKALLSAEIGKLSITQEKTTRLVVKSIEEAFYRLGTPLSTLNSNEREIIGDSLEALFPRVKRELQKVLYGGP